MSLRLLDLPLLLKPSDHDLFRDFFAPALTHAFHYDRGVGYFASGWLRLAAQGMAKQQLLCDILTTEHIGAQCTPWRQTVGKNLMEESTCLH